MATNNAWNNQIAASNSAITLNSGTNTVSVSTDATNTTLNIGTGGGVKTCTFGSTNTTSPTTLQSGSGALAVTSTGGTLTINSGTGALGVSTDASATTISLGTGGAVKALTLGSTNTTSSTAIKSGSGNVVINTGLTIDSTGRNYNTVQPAFQAYRNSNSTNFCGNTAGQTITFATEAFDQGANYDTGTYTFTAPITGKYQLSTSVWISNITIGNQAFIQIVTTATKYYSPSLNPTAAKANFGAIGFCVDVLADMTAGDTALVKMNSEGEAANTQTLRGDARTDTETFFSGYLVC